MMINELEDDMIFYMIDDHFNDENAETTKEKMMTEALFADAKGNVFLPKKTMRRTNFMLHPK